MVETNVLRYRTFISYVFLTNLALNFAEVLRGNNWSKKHIVFSANNVRMFQLHLSFKFPSEDFL